MSDTRSDNVLSEAPAWNLARLLRAYRERRGLTQEDVKAATSIGVSTLSEYERGKGHVPSQYAIELLANLYQASPTEREDLLDAREALLAQRRPSRAQRMAPAGRTAGPAPHLLTTPRSAPTPRPSQAVSDESAVTPPRIRGWLLSVAPIGNGNRVMLATNPRTGVTVQLLPSDDERLIPRDGAYMRPAYSRVRQELAYILRVPGQFNSVWVVPLIGVDGDERLRVAPPGPRYLFTATWPHCDSLAWSPDGTTLICEGERGLVAVDRDTLEPRVVTHGYDAWPAYSPDGHWLVYQHNVGPFGYLRALPCAGNLPLGDDETLARYPVGYAPSWCPAFRPDGKLLAFASAVKEQVLESLRVFVVAVDMLAAQTDPMQHAPVHVVSGVACSDPLWIRGAWSAAAEVGAAAPAVMGPAAHDLLVYTCFRPTPALNARLIPSGNASVWRLGGMRTPGPPLYSPCWIPPYSA